MDCQSQFLGTILQVCLQVNIGEGMANYNTGIEWCEATWNVVTGCDKVSSGCKHCYAERMSKRLAGRFGYPADDPFKVTLHEDRLQEPEDRKKPTKYFVCSMGDIFHEDVPFDFIDLVIAEIAMCPQHEFIMLTKRADRMLAYMKSRQRKDTPQGNEWFCKAWEKFKGRAITGKEAFHLLDLEWPLPNLTLMVSVEDQPTADLRIPDLLLTPAAKRGVSYEPALGPVIFDPYLKVRRIAGKPGDLNPKNFLPSLDLIIAGGETGHSPRPDNVEWYRETAYQSKHAGVAFYMKQRSGKAAIPKDLQIKQWPE